MSNPGQIRLPAQDPDVVRARQVKISDEQMQAIQNAAGGDPLLAQQLEHLLRTENRGFKYVNNDANSGKGALGAFQFTGPTWMEFGEGDHENARDFDTAARAAARMVRKIWKGYSNDPAVVGAYYDGGGKAARAVMAGNDPPLPETQQYVRIMRGLSAPIEQLPTRQTGTDMLAP